MYSQEQRKLAIETYIELDYSIADTVATLGFPNRHTLSTWWKEYESTGEIPVGKNRHRESMYSDRQARAAANHYLEHGKSLARTMRALGYPKSRMTLCKWIDELAPGERKKRGPNPKRDPVPIEERIRVVAELEARTGAAAEIAERHGVSRTAPYVWRREIMGDNAGGHRRERPSREQGIRRPARRRRRTPGHAARGEDAAQEGAAGARRAAGDPRDSKKRPGRRPGPPDQRGEGGDGVCEILPVAGMAKSSYEYARNARAKGESDERADARSAVVEAFGASGGTYGYRRIAAVVDAGEWTVRGIMGDGGLVARAAKKKRRYSSYEGEISAAPPPACCATIGAGTISAPTAPTSCGSPTSRSSASRPARSTCRP